MKFADEDDVDVLVDDGGSVGRDVHVSVEAGNAPVAAEGGRSEGETEEQGREDEDGCHSAKIGFLRLLAALVAQDDTLH